MNLHEECLLKYLLDCDNLFRMTDILELHNKILSVDGKNSHYNNSVKFTPVQNNL